MAVNNLDNFRIDCRLKEQQIKFLQGMRTTADDRLMAGLSNLGQPWKVFTDFPEYRQRMLVNNGYSNWSINQLLLRLAHDCP